MQKTSFLLAFLMAILLSSCSPKSTVSAVYVEMEMLNPPMPTEVLHDVDRYVSLEDTAEPWNPFNHKNNTLEAVIRYQYVYSDEDIIRDSMRVELKGNRTANGKKTVSTLFSNAELLKEPETEKKHALAMGDIEGELAVGGFRTESGAETGFQVNYSYNLLEGGYGSGVTGEVGIRLLYPNAFATDQFTHAFPGRFKQGESDVLLAEFELSNVFSDSMGAEQVAAIKQNPSGLRVTFEVARGSTKTTQRCKAMGEQVFEYFNNREPYLESRTSPKMRELHTALTTMPIVKARPDGRDQDLIVMQLQYGKPNPSTNTSPIK